MKRSSAIQITLLSSVAAMVTGCHSDLPPRRCVDNANRVVDERFCRGDYRGIGPVFIPYHYYYGGPRGYIPLGAMLSGGSTASPRSGYSTPPSTSSGAASGTARGGIGAAGEAASGHGAGE